MYSRIPSSFFFTGTHLQRWSKVFNKRCPASLITRVPKSVGTATVAAMGSMYSRVEGALVYSAFPARFDAAAEDEEANRASGNLEPDSLKFGERMLTILDERLIAYCLGPGREWSMPLYRWSAFGTKVRCMVCFSCIKWRGTPCMHAPHPMHVIRGMLLHTCNVHAPCLHVQYIAAL